MFPVLLCVSRLVQGAIFVLAVSPISMGNPAFGKEAEYFRVAIDFVFAEEKLFVLPVKNLMKCATLCSLTDECNGVNYQRLTTPVGQMASCEVLELSEDPADVTLVSRTGWSAYRLGLKATITDSFTIKAKENEVTTRKEAITLSTLNSKISTNCGFVENSKMTTDGGFDGNSKTTPDTGFVDNNPEYCSIDGAFTYNNQIYLVSGDAVYVFADVTKLSTGPIKTRALSDVMPGISAPIGSIFIDETDTNLHVIKGDTLTTYSTPSSTFTWSQTQQTTVASFFGRSFGTITGIYEFNGDTIILLDRKVTALSTQKSMPMNSNSPHNILRATNKNSSPGSTSAASALRLDYVLVIDSNLAYSFNKPTGSDKGTWATLGNVRCRII